MGETRGGKTVETPERGPSRSVRRPYNASRANSRTKGKASLGESFWSEVEDFATVRLRQIQVISEQR